MSALNTRLRAQLVAIGALSEATGVNTETIRYYERIGLLPAPRRTEGRHRQYEEPHRRRLVFIRRARELGFSLDEVRSLLGLGGRHNLSCGEVKDLTEHHVAEIREKVRDLKRLERILGELARQCRGDKVPSCPILDALNAGS